MPDSIEALREENERLRAALELAVDLIARTHPAMFEFARDRADLEAIVDIRDSARAVLSDQGTRVGTEESV